MQYSPSPQSYVCFNYRRPWVGEADIRSRISGRNELSYFLPSRAVGVDNMHLHLDFHTSYELISPQRVRAIWGPLATRAFTPRFSDPYRLRFLLHKIRESSFTSSSKDDLLSSHLNSPRLLPSSRTSFLIIACDPEEDDKWCYWIGDSMALHTCANEILLLLGAGGGVDKSRQVVALEFSKRTTLPRSVKAALPNLSHGLRRAAAIVENNLLPGKRIGGQPFPRTKGLKRKTVVPTYVYLAYYLGEDVGWRLCKRGKGYQVANVNVHDSISANLTQFLKVSSPRACKRISDTLVPHTTRQGPKHFGSQISIHYSTHQIRVHKREEQAMKN
ncbi:hypothetical protein OPQ81_011790 [Rhizoctonia solani]|nr:hypothetical protein OPQ81_011790 [Rhizoctonia solani]